MSLAKHFLVVIVCIGYILDNISYDSSILTPVLAKLAGSVSQHWNIYNLRIFRYSWKNILPFVCHLICNTNIIEYRTFIPNISIMKPILLYHWHFVGSINMCCTDTILDNTIGNITMISLLLMLR